MKFDKKKLIKSTISNGLIVGATDYAVISAREYVPKYLNVVSDPNKVGAVTHSFINDWLADPAQVLAAAANQTHSLPVQLGAAALFLGLFAKDAWNARKHKVEKAAEYGAFGTSKFLTANEIVADKADFTMNLKEPGTIIGMLGGKPVIHKEKSWKNRNVIVFGASGTQKSKSYIIPNILNTDSDSIIVTDPKSELYEKTSEAKRKQGYKVHLINFDIAESLNSDKYNSLDYIKTDIDAADLGNSIIINANGVPASGDTFWINSEAGVIATLTLYAKYFLPKKQQNLGSVYNILVTNPESLDNLFKNVPEDHIVKRSYNGCIGTKEEKMKAQIMGGAATAIDLWKYSEARQLTSQSDFNLQDIGKEKMIIYLKIPVGKKYARPLISTFFNQLFEQLYTLAESNHGELPNPVRMLLDEFAQIGQISMFEERLSTTRSLKIYVSIIVQSLEQLRNRYGREKAAEIMDNCDIHMFLGTNDKDAQKHFSEKLGTTTIRIQGESETKNDRGESLGESRNYTQRPLMTADEINRLPDDKTIVFMRTKHPLMLDKAYYTKLKPLANLMQNVVKITEYQPANVSEYEVFQPPIVKKKKKQAQPKQETFIEELAEAVSVAELEADIEEQPKQSVKFVPEQSEEEALFDL
ncbi:VirD4-like conjugal transfer protein, CD1115 family [Priestia megaterium]|uniref:VirD4-like conjugal transfer protein, CD1115 family n=1 Tax=Priestia megaterium TaxID=1404 RepID=UPI002785F1BC|nr:type IV secretory system conjugative DNA transfer family protein [Priestia megaterium]MDQ0808043.1 type IV secretion system protein VirD4 [Priestia megaterium]